jgi:hypothetical protein
MHHDALFGQLRSILQRPASRETWVELCDQLDLWPSDKLEQLGLPYALDIVTRWPADVARKAPHRWVNRLVAGRDVALLCLTTSLELYTYHGSREQHAAALAASPHLQNLITLDLAHNTIGEAGAAALAASPHLSNLSHLNLPNNQIGPAGAAALAASPHLQNLSALNLYSNTIRDAGVASLAASPYLRGLISLNLGHNKIGPKGAAALAASTNLTNLAALDLSHNKIGDAGAAALAASPHLPEPIRAQWRKP